MKYTPADTGFPSGIPTWKRRYSSTAVEFPIRNDQKPHSHGCSDGFPSWERARLTPTYVHTRTMSAPTTENRQPYCSTSPALWLTNHAPISPQYPLCALKNPAQYLTKPLRAPIHLLTYDSPTNHNPLSTTTQRPHYLLTIRSLTTHQSPTNQSPINHVSLGVRLRFTWESLALVHDWYLVRSSHN